MCDNGGGGSKRQEMKALIKKFRQTSNMIDKNIFNSVGSVNLDTIFGYKKGRKVFNFLDEYDD